MKFHFKQFSILQAGSPMKVGTDGVLTGAWANAKGCRHGLDIGTGTGLITLMIMQRFPQLRMTAIEPNKTAYHEAVKNFSACKWTSRITCVQTSLQDFSSEGLFDLIVSNPPFYSATTNASGEGRSQARQAIHLPSAELLEGVDRLLSPAGKFCVILPEAEARRFILRASETDLFLSAQLMVQPEEKKPVHRRLMEFTRNRGGIRQGHIAIRNGSEYSTEYIALTRRYYIHFE